MAMTAESLRAPLLYVIDIKNGLIQQPIRTQLMKGDKKANTIVVRVMDGSEAADLTGATATGSFISPVEDAEIPLEGSVNGNEVRVMLVDECYAEDGYFEANVKLTVGETSRTILSITGTVLSKGSGVVIDVGDVIPNIDDIIAQYAEMKRVTQETQAAANAANAATDRVEQMQIDASGLAGDSNRLGGKLPGYYTNPRNLLDNSDFRNPVNQRGRAGTNLTAGYMLDRWKIWEDGGTVYFNAGKYMGVEEKNLYQYLPEPYDRGVLTAAVKVYGVDTPFVCTLDTSVLKSASNMWVWITREESALSVALVCNQVYEWAALYEGEYTADNLPQYVPKGYYVELAECQHYYRKDESVYCVADSNGYWAYNHDVPMRLQASTTTVKRTSDQSEINIVYRSKKGIMVNGLSAGARIGVNVERSADL